MPNDNELRALLRYKMEAAIARPGELPWVRPISSVVGEWVRYADVAALATAAPAGGEVDAWQPIETAPHDISLALVAWMDGDWQYDFERREDGRWWQHEDNREHYVAVSHMAGVTVTGRPETAPYTHWLPIAPPALHTPKERT